LIPVTVVHIMVFSVSGIFSSRVIRTCDEVLIQRVLCGFPRNPVALKSPDNFTATDWEAQEAFYLSGNIREETSEKIQTFSTLAPVMRSKALQSHH